MTSYLDRPDFGEQIWKIFDNPIALSEIQGRSRNWGDISTTKQKAVIGQIIKQARSAKLDIDAISYLLATARIESGFNPDAAAKTSSASGIGQFINSTGRAYGLDGNKRFSLTKNIKALISLSKDNISAIKRKWNPQNKDALYRLAYAVHHDGFSLKYGGMDIADKQVLPWQERYRKWLITLK